MSHAELAAELTRISEARHHDPFSVLGRHPDGDQVVVRVFNPHATEMFIAEGGLPMERLPGSHFFQWRGQGDRLPERYRLIWRDEAHYEHIAHDPYTYAPQLQDFDLHLFGEGRHRHAYRCFGAHPRDIDGVAGTRFTVWAPNAERVSVVGDFNRWDGRCHPMRVRNGGVWELFIPDLEPGHAYKYEIRNRHTGHVLLKSDPYGQQHELRPRTASVIPASSGYQWGDHDWMENRRQADWQHLPMSIYEVHLGSWQRGIEGEFLGYRELAHHLARPLSSRIATTIASLRDRLRRWTRPST